MNFDTWMREFYPVRAEEAESAREHSIQKWAGMLPESLKKRKVTLEYYSPGKMRGDAQPMLELLQQAKELP